MYIKDDMANFPAHLIHEIVQRMSPRTRARMNASSKATTTTTSVVEYRALAKNIAEKHFVYHDGSEKVINLDVTVSRKLYDDRRLAFDYFIIEDDTIQVVNDDYDPTDPAPWQGRQAYLNKLTHTNRRSTQNLLIHAAACYFVVSNHAMIQEVTDNLPEKQEWRKLATYLLRQIEKKLTTAETYDMTISRSSIESIQQSASRSLSASRSASQSQSQQPTIHQKSLRARQLEITNSGVDILKTTEATNLLKKKELDKTLAIKREKNREKLNLLVGGKSTKHNNASRRH